MGEVLQVDNIILLTGQIVLDVHPVRAPDSFHLGVDTLADILWVIHV